VRPVAPSDILDLTAYERVRADFLRRMIEHKRPRRIEVGDKLTFIFEDRDTVIFQIQELTRAERTVDPAEIAIECRIFNELVPGPDELSATLMIEVTEASRIRAELDRLVGIDEHVFMDVGGSAVQASFDPKQREEDRISAVQYVKFPLGAELAARFTDPGVPVALRVEHPAYRAATRIEGESRASLAADLKS
jgi:uncharacterized protein DUF3501